MKVSQIKDSILVNAVVVNQLFEIVLIGENILTFLKYSRNDLVGLSINNISGSNDLIYSLRKEFSKGQFRNFQTRFFSKTQKAIQVSLSGEDLGLSSPVNNYLLLIIENLDEAESKTIEVLNRLTDFDNFIYRAAHDLRGPLATIKGLINLLKIRDDDHEVDRLVNLLDAHANKLDDRLLNLVQVSHSENESFTSKNLVNFNEIETTLRKTIEQNAFVDFLELHFTAPQEILRGVNEVLLQGLVNNLLLHVLSLPILHFDGNINFDFKVISNKLVVILTSKGFAVNSSINKIIEAKESFYSEIMNYQHLVNFYKARKIALKLSSDVKAEFLSDSVQKITLTIPLINGDN